MSTLSETARAVFGVEQPPSTALDGFQKLTLADRCDVGDCGAAAYVRAEFKSGSILFCGHHFAAYEPQARERATRIQDERYRLSDTAKLDVSA